MATSPCCAERGLAQGMPPPEHDLIVVIATDPHDYDGGSLVWGTIVAAIE